MKLVYFVLLVSLTSANSVANVFDQLEYTSPIDIIVQLLDKNSDAKITLEDLEEVGGRFGDVPLEAIIRKLDKNNDNAVDHTDLKIEVEKLSNALVGMQDFDDNGYITRDEVNYVNNVLIATTVKGLELCLTFLFDLADLNADGIISDSDFPKLAPFQKLKSFLNQDNNFIGSQIVLLLLKTIDVNEDYQISKSEVTQLLTKMAETVDMNDDGTVTLQEILQSMVWFDLVDLNDDQFISDDDYPELAPFQKLKTLTMRNKDAMLSKLVSVLLKAVDVNEDYEISKTESTQFLTETMDKLDQNDDGTLKFKEVLETMEEFKFPEKFVQQGELIHDISNKSSNLAFNHFDVDADGRINGDEMSNAFTKPMSSSYLKEIQELYAPPPHTYVEGTYQQYAPPPHTYVEGTYQQEMNATIASLSSFLRSSSSAAGVKISFILTCFVFVCSVLIN